MLAVVLLGCSIGLPVSHAQAFTPGSTTLIRDTTRHARVANGVIATGVDRVTGRFWIETASGVPLLFRKDAITSFSNIRAGGRVYTNNTVGSGQTPLGTRALPPGTTEVLTDRLRFRTRITAQDVDLDVEQEFLPSLDSTYAYVRITTTLVNRGSAAVTAGALLMLDFVIDDVDNIDVLVDGMQVTRERGWSGDAVPAGYEGHAPAHPWEVVGRLDGRGATRPDRYTVGRWQSNGSLGAVSWDYEASGLAIWDAAALLQWNERSIAPGARVSFASDYGYRTLMRATLACGADTLAVDATQRAYEPDPFTVTATVVNTSVIALPDIDVAMAAPAGFTLAAGEQAVHMLTGPVAPGSSVQTSWRMHAPLDTIARRATIPVSIVAPALIAQHCSVEIDVPALPVFRLELECPDTLRLAPGGDGRRYIPDPFDVPITVRNTGTGTLQSLLATLATDPGIDLVGTGVENITPSPLPPGATGFARFSVHVPPRVRDTILTCSISVVASQNIRLTCTVPVVIPALPPPPPCVMNGRGTRGTEFWLGFPENGSTTGVRNNVLFIVASEESSVRVDRPATGQFTDVTVLPGEAVRVEVEDLLDDHAAEQPGDKGVHVTSDRPVMVIAGTLCTLHGDATLVLPMHALGTHYVTAGYNFFDPDEHVLITGAHDGTTVTITPGGVTSTNRPAGVPFQIALDAGGTYAIRAGLTGAGGGLTGTVVSADKPVAVTSGARSGWVPVNTLPWYAYLNPHFHQMIPTSLCGTSYVAAPFASRRGGATFKVVATANGTDVTISDGTFVTLTRMGESYEFTIDAPVSISATHPVQVVQFAHSAAWDADTNEYGDAMMIALAPVSRFMTCHDIATGIDERFDSSFVTVFAHDGAGVLLDGVPIEAAVMAPIPGTSIRYASLPLTRGVHRIESLDRRGVGAVVYGFEHHDAFGYNAGFLVVDSTVAHSTVPSAVRRFTIGTVWPHPVTTRGIVTITASRRASLRLDLHDVRGRHVCTLFDGMMDAGERDVVFDMRSLATGSYTLVLTHPDGRAVRTLVRASGW